MARLCHRLTCAKIDINSDINAPSIKAIALLAGGYAIALGSASPQLCQSSAKNQQSSRHYKE
ncbi:hypothetical protein [Nostoc sp. C110]|uniref:hypothetical protein n=1 Tax=Nostoc sp. C110 TaxID=3349876 RepID=UPI00370D8D6A